MQSTAVAPKRGDGGTAANRSLEDKERGHVVARTRMRISRAAARSGPLTVAAVPRRRTITTDHVIQVMSDSASAQPHPRRDSIASNWRTGGAGDTQNEQRKLQRQTVGQESLYGLHRRAKRKQQHVNTRRGAACSVGRNGGRLSCFYVRRARAGLSHGQVCLLRRCQQGGHVDAVLFEDGLLVEIVDVLAGQAVGWQLDDVVDAEVLEAVQQDGEHEHDEEHLEVGPGVGPAEHEVGEEVRELLEAAEQQENAHLHHGEPGHEHEELLDERAEHRAGARHRGAGLRLVQRGVVVAALDVLHAQRLQPLVDQHQPAPQNRDADRRVHQEVHEEPVALVVRLFQRAEQALALHDAQQHIEQVYPGRPDHLLSHIV